LAPLGDVFPVSQATKTPAPWIYEIPEFDINKKYSVRVEWLRQKGRALSEPSETPSWQITPHPASIQCVALYMTLQSLFRWLFVFCQSSI
jgi:hypothetical protein